jgi:hypothetical protein
MSRPGPGAAIQQAEYVAPCLLCYVQSALGTSAWVPAVMMARPGPGAAEQQAEDTQQHQYSKC